MNPDLTAFFQQYFKSTELSLRPVHGGDISTAYQIQTESNRYFVKLNHSDFADNFQVELQSLNYLRGKSSLKIPESLSTGVYQQFAFLSMAYIESAQPSQAFWIHLGKGLAALHQNSNDQYGFAHPTYIGSIKVNNEWYSEWEDFYWNQRLLPLMKIGILNGLFDQDDLLKLENIIHRQPSYFPQEFPALCHGDLWSGNYVCHQDTPYLIDPSVAYYHREMDIAMTRLFGGFDSLFYQAYQEYYPLKPDWEERIELYQLYYLLVHALLFKGGYIQRSRSIIKKFSQ